MHADEVRIADTAYVFGLGLQRCQETPGAPERKTKLLCCVRLRVLRKCERLRCKPEPSRRVLDGVRRAAGIEGGGGPAGGTLRTCECALGIGIVAREDTLHRLCTPDQPLEQDYLLLGLAGHRRTGRSLAAGCLHIRETGRGQRE